MSQEIVDLALGYLRHYRAVYVRREEPTPAEDRASDDVNHLSMFGDADRLWDLSAELIARSQTIRELGYVAAGPLEDLMRRFGDRYLRELGRRSASDPRWRFAIRGTYPDRMAPKVASLVTHLARAHREDELARATGLPDDGRAADGGRGGI